MARGDDIQLVIQGIDLGFRQHVDYNGPVRLGAKLFLTDEVIVQFDSHLQFDDNIWLTDDIDVFNGIRVVVDVMGVVDGGRLLLYSYAGNDYFATPLDYVGEQRVF